MAPQPIIIIDFGSQYTMLIARRIRELCVYCEIVSDNITEQALKQKSPLGIILSGSPDSAPQTNQHLTWLWNLDTPILGICFGMQWMAHSFAGEISHSNTSEFGPAVIKTIDNPLFANTARQLNVWMSHGDQVSSVPTGFSVIASSSDCKIAAIAHQTKPLYGVQFHPEVTHTEQGTQLLKNFIIGSCQAPTDWKPTIIAEEMITRLRDQIGKDKVLLALSGGVDSSVVAALLHKAIGDQLTCVFIDHGLLRLNERQHIEQIFQKEFRINLVTMDTRDIFLNALKGVSDPEKKRKIIGGAFIDAFTKFTTDSATKIKWLAQGTIYPDVIESSSSGSKSAAIKSHHNVGGLPDDLPFKLIEPIRMLFKDEVRLLGLELGLPHELLYRHPFPGPGLAVRIMGEVKQQYCDILRYADNIFYEELKKSGWYEKTSQAFVVFLPVKTVGVAGDKRIYDYAVSLRAVVTDDFMTATAAQLPYSLLTTTANRIMNEVDGVSRVVYDISSKPPSTIEWE